MKICISGHAAAFDKNDEEITSASELAMLSGAKSAESCLSFIDRSLVDIGLAGGELEFIFDELSGRLRIQTVYHSPRELKKIELQQLVIATKAQWSDGIGGGDFRLKLEDIILDAYPVSVGVDVDDVTVEQIDDGVPAIKPNQKSNNALFSAARNGDVAKLRSLLDQGADVNARNQDEFTPLIVAAARNQPDCVELLIAARADLDACDCVGETACGSAAMFGYTEVLERLLKAGADPNHFGNGGGPPLHMACNRGQFGAVKLLVQYGADVNLQCKGGGYSPLMSLEADEIEIAKFLLEHGADTELINQSGEGMDAELKRAII